MSIVAVLDANVLIPNALCDLLLRLAEEEVYRPRWSAQILDEVRRNLPGVPAAAERRIAFMNVAFDTAMVHGYEYLVSDMTNHVKDRHVLAAAVACDADRIITCNLRDFPIASCEPHGVEPEHPDDFLLGVWEREPQLIMGVLQKQAADTGRHGPRLTLAAVLDYLASAGARSFAETVRPHLPKADESTPVATGGSSAVSRWRAGRG
ncbi:MAG TPA: PIN domain-containing protein [Micromonosporaceae bacterium]|nr:PIN domain-containing protein [Micromonosporaceae bacterium]